MMTVNDVSKLTGVSVRTLQYYDGIGLLKPSGYTESGYRLYDDKAIDRLQQILLFKELELSLKEIKSILDAPNFDRSKVIEEQINLLTMKREHLDNLINFSRRVKLLGVRGMDFTVFDTKRINEYENRAEEQWGQTPECKEFKEKTKDWTNENQQDIFKNFMLIFAEFGKIKSKDPANDEVQLQVKNCRITFQSIFIIVPMKFLVNLARCMQVVVNLPKILIRLEELELQIFQPRQ